MTTLLELISKPNRQYRKAGSRYVGPCPKCGGSDKTDKFVTKIGSETGHCFTCGVNINTIGYLMEFEGMKCHEAHTAVGKECEKTSCPAYEKCRGIKPTRQNYRQSIEAPASSLFTPHASEAKTPSEKWQDQALKLIERCHAALLETPKALSYLAKRGINQDVVKKHKLGWLAGEKGQKCIYRSRAAWGLAEILKENGKPKMLWIPRGIIIPSFVGDRVDRIRIRRPNGDLLPDSNGKKPPKYIAIEDGGTHVISLNPQAKAQIIIESDLDALLVDHLAGDIVGAIPLTSVGVRPNGMAAEACSAATIILVALDFDKPALNEKTGRMETPAAKHWPWWKEHYPQAVRLPVPVGKDPGEAYEKGVDLRKWILVGLPISLHPGKQVEVEVKVKETQNSKLKTQNSTITEITLKNGRMLYLTNDPVERARLKREGKLSPSMAELEKMKQAAASGVNMELVIDSLEVFGGVIEM